MLNRFYDTTPKEYFCNGFSFTDYRLYCNYRDKYFKDTLRRGTSLPLRPKKKIGYLDIQLNMDIYGVSWSQMNLFTNNYIYLYGKKVCLSESRSARGCTK